CASTDHALPATAGRATRSCAFPRCRRSGSRSSPDRRSGRSAPGKRRTARRPPPSAMRSRTRSAGPGAVRPSPASHSYGPRAEATMRVTLLSGGAAQGLIAALAPRFKAETGHDIAGSFGAVGAMRDELLAGAAADLLLLTSTMIAELVRHGHAVAASVAD